MPGPDNEPSLSAPHLDSSANATFAVVGIGASAGGLVACQKLLDTMPADHGMAFILVQHLDPSHPSLMAELLARHTTMRVHQAGEGMLIVPDTLYAIPPGTYLSVVQGALHLSQPDAPHGARLPFDFLLHSLAEEYSGRAVGMVLSGTGYDGTLGVAAIRQNGGFVIAQQPSEAEYNGMPNSGIALKLQIFASDIDVDAIAAAREGVYPVAIEADVSPERLARFFNHEMGHYRVTAELRAAVVFTVQDILTDPPFSRMDIISCRNVLIYLRPEAQAKMISLFYFAL